MSYASALSFDLSPVRLNYVGALRGLKPHSFETTINYAQTGDFQPETLICLAASNPNGQFYGLVTNAGHEKAAAHLASSRKITNVTFVSNAADLPTALHYLVCDHASACPTQKQRTDLFSLAETNLAPGGYLAFRYKTYDNADQSLQFLIADYAPVLTPEKALEFLFDLKAIGSLYFNDHPIARAALDKAIEAKNPSSFFETCGAGEQGVESGAFETLAGLLPRDFSFVGEAEIGSNYIELAAPAASHKALETCRDHLLYEAIKDFALQRLVRNDVWVKRPVTQTFDNVELYGNFTFGITTPRERIPPTVSTQGGAVNLSTPLFTRLIELMSTLPVGIGDFLQHPAGMGMEPDDVVGAVQVLVACGVAQPMRGRYPGKSAAGTARPVWASSYNEFLTDMDVTETTVRLASSIVGGAVTLSAREALVLQAVRRVGLPNSSGALQIELKKIIQKNPALAAQIMDTTEPTDELVNNMLTNVVTNGMVRWYAYGLLAA